MTIKPLEQIGLLKNHFKVFLAGSIEMGTAENWQEKIEQQFNNELNIVFLNPRRDDWDASWKQDKNDPPFFAQVNWELTHLEMADLIVVYFDPKTKSPITMLELGLFASTNKLIVCCPKGFWRKGNIDIVCDRYQIKQVKDLNTIIDFIKTKNNDHAIKSAHAH